MLYPGGACMYSLVISDTCHVCRTELTKGANTLLAIKRDLRLAREKVTL